MGAFDDLLTVQGHDSAIERLAAQRAKLAERAQIAEREQEATELSAQLDEIVAAREEANREEKRLEDNVAAIEERRAEVEAAMYSGTTSNPKELQAMQAEIEMFGRQQRSLEDQELGFMERREGLDGEIAQLEEKLAEVRADVEQLASTLAEKEREIDEQCAGERAGRDAAAAGLPPDLVDLYEAIRVKNAGVGAARLAGDTCQGCHLALPAVEVDRIKKQPADALVRCEQCGCILVR